MHLLHGIRHHSQKTLNLLCNKIIMMVILISYFIKTKIKHVLFLKTKQNFVAILGRVEH